MKVHTSGVKTCQLAQTQSWMANICQIIELLFCLSEKFQNSSSSSVGPRRFGYVLVDGENVLVQKLAATAGAVSASAPKRNAVPVTTLPSIDMDVEAKKTSH